ncbi:MAG: DUF5320 domain-containing protein [Dehalococcoidia bacterium]|nr:DUF5320 domain-containing protein [Dehalococcoidia bacterium]
MPGFDGTGPAGMGPMTGGGRGFCSPWRIRSAAGIYGRTAYRPYPYTYTSPYSDPMTRDQEIEFLKDQAAIMKRQLEDIEASIKVLQK